MEAILNRIADYLQAQSWQVAMVVLIVAALSWVLRRRSAHVRYLLWLVVLAKCLVPPIVNVSLPILPEPAAPVQPPAVVERPYVAPSALPAPAEPLPLLPALPPAPSVAPARHPLTTRQWLAIVWLVGAVSFMFAAIVKAIRTTRWLKRTRRAIPEDVQSNLISASSRRISRKLPRMWLVEGVGQPFVWGLVRGDIYLPHNFTANTNDEHRLAILRHELSHVLRFDAAINSLQIVAQAIFWFHPLVRWANRRIRQEREKCCDETALALTGSEAKTYCHAIIETLRNAQPPARSVPSLAIAGSAKNIEERIRTLLRPGRRFYRRPSLAAAVAVLLIALLAVPAAFVLTAAAGTDDGITLSGRVLNAAGEPVTDAEVVAYEMYSDGLAGNMLFNPLDTVTTGNNGTFRLTFESKPERRTFIECYVVAMKEGLALGWMAWDMVESTESDIILGAPATLAGAVVDEDGEPVANAEIRVNLFATVGTGPDQEKAMWLPGIPPFGELITGSDAEGCFAIGGLPANTEADLLVLAPGKATTYTYDPGPGEHAFVTGQYNAQVMLPDEARVEGRIVDPNTGEGLPQAEFACVWTASGLFFYRFVCTADETGRFAIGGLKSGRYLLRAKNLPSTYVETTTGETTHVTLRANKLYYGRVLFDDGTPAVVKLASWPEAETSVHFAGQLNGRGPDLGVLDSEGYFCVYLSEEQAHQIQTGPAQLYVEIPTGNHAGRREDISAANLLATSKAQAGVAVVPRPYIEPASLVGHALPPLNQIGHAGRAGRTEGKRLLICLFDVNQRPSRNCLLEANRNAESLAAQGIEVLGVQAAEMQAETLDEWLSQNAIAIPVGQIASPADRTRFTWGANALPWLILTDEQHIVVATAGAWDDLAGHLSDPPARSPVSGLEPDSSQHRVAGHVLADQTEDPIANALVRIAVPAVDMRFARAPGKQCIMEDGATCTIYETRTDSDGWFETLIPIVEGADAFSVDAMAPGYGSAAGTFRGGGGNPSLLRMNFETMSDVVASSLTIRLPKTIYVAGTVKDEFGAPVGQAEVSGQMRTDGSTGGIARTVTDEQGRFEIFDFPAQRRPDETAELCLTSPSIMFTKLVGLYDLSAEQLATLEINVQRGQRVTGTVLDADGRPAAGATVEPVDILPRRETVTDSNGHFELAGLASGPIRLLATDYLHDQKGTASAVLEARTSNVTLQMARIKLETRLEPITLFGMQLVNVTAELQEAYDLPRSNGVMILDPGADHERLKIGKLLKGYCFWMVGDEPVSNIREMLTELVNQAKPLSVPIFVDPPLMPRRFRVVFMMPGAVNTQYLSLTSDDIEQLRQLAEQLDIRVADQTP